MKKSLLTLIMALVMALACATSAFAEDLGYVNVERVFRSYPRYSDYYERYQSGAPKG